MIEIITLVLLGVVFILFIISLVLLGRIDNTLVELRKDINRLNRGIKL